VYRKERYFAVFSLFTTLVITSAFTCSCGHLPAVALPVTVFATVLAWIPFICKVQHGIVWRLFLMLVVILSSYSLVMNIVDVLWFGHNPLLGHK
jgi:hypothetical protein